MHIPQFENNNKPIVDCNSEIVPLCYFNIIKLSAGEEFSYQLSGYETCIVPATGTIDVEVEGQTFKDVGKRSHIWESDPEGVYIPVNIKVRLICHHGKAEVFVSGGKHNETYEAFVQHWQLLNLFAADRWDFAIGKFNEGLVKSGVN